MSFNFDDDRDISQLLSALDKERDRANALEKQLSGVKDSVKKTAIESAFRAAGGKVVPTQDGTSFLDLTTKQVDPHVKVNQAGQIEIVDRHGIKRYSSKDSTQGMSLDELFQELKTHEIAQNFFHESAELSPAQKIAAMREAQKEPTQARIAVDPSLSRADQLTQIRAALATEQPQKARSDVRWQDSSLSPAERLTRARLEQAQQ